MLGHDPQHTGRSAYTGPQTSNLRWTSEALDYGPRTPVVAGDGSIIAAGSKKVYSINPADGTFNWVSPDVCDSILTAPTLGADGVIYVGGIDWALHALSPVNGGEEWRFWTRGNIQSTPTIGPDGRIYFGSGDYSLYCVDTLTHQLVWSFAAGYEAYIMCSPALSPGGDVYFSSRHGWLQAVTHGGVYKWAQRFNLSSWPPAQRSPVVGADGTVYMATAKGSVFAYDGQGGEQKWEFYIPDHTVWDMPALAADGTVYAGYSNGTVYAIDPSDGSTEWESPVDTNHSFNSPVVGADGKVYIANQGGWVFCLAPDDGAKVWEYKLPLGGVYYQSSITEDGTLLVPCSDWHVYAFQDAAP
jgi:outer membrane protein assembly factor BamB